MSYSSGKVKNLKYNLEPSFCDINSAVYNIVQFVRPQSKILDLGCATGILGKYLKDKLCCYVVGVDRNPEYREYCIESLNEFYLEDLNDGNSLQLLETKEYDYIILADVLEHLIDDKTFLDRLSQLITKSQYVIVSVPNICFWESRLKIFFGSFEYTEYGIFDETHLHFYNLYYARKLFSTYFNIISESYSSWYMILEKYLYLWKIPFIRKIVSKYKHFILKIFPNFYSSQIVFLLQSKDKNLEI